MFPLPWNKEYRKKDGTITTIDDAISQGGGGEPYTLPTASANTKGGIKIGNGLSMTGETLNNDNPIPYSLPAATAEVLGGIKVGSGLSIEEGVLSVPGGGSGSLHLYLVTTNQTAAMKSYILTTVEAEITNLNSLKTALTTGFGFVTSGYIPGGTSAAPVFLTIEDNSVTVKYLIQGSGSDVWHSQAITSGTATISSTKIF